jgi:alpha-2-macroglobulin
VTNDRDREYMLIEDPIPSGCRITERDELMEGESWPFWWSRTVVLDDKASFFARYMRMGVGEFTYTIRVENPGRFSALPTEIYNMYEPQDRASAGSHTLEVR